MGNSFGHLFRVTTWGESHGAAIGAVVDGCPPLLELSEADIQPELDRRAPGQSSLVTQRKESDSVRILSGVFEGRTLGTPISLLIPNEDMRPGDYREVQEKYRPSHADYTYDAKFGIRDWRGGGRTSARETAGRVAAGAIARKLLAVRHSVEIVAWVSKVGRISVDRDAESVSREQVERTPIRCPDPAVAEQMIAAVEAARKEGNSLGGVITCAVRGCPAGWGEPVFDRLEADLAKAMLSLPASKGFEIGSGFAGTDLTGLERPRPHPHEQQRRRPGRHQQRRDDLLPRRLQADGHGDARAAHRYPPPRGHDDPGPRPARPLRAAACCADGGGDGGAGARRSRASAVNDRPGVVARPRQKCSSYSASSRLFAGRC
jgi:chorismate synthase